MNPVVKYASVNHVMRMSWVCTHSKAKSSCHNYRMARTCMSTVCLSCRSCSERHILVCCGCHDEAILDSCQHGFVIAAMCLISPCHGSCSTEVTTWGVLLAGLLFVVQFFVCRVVIANYYWSRMISGVAALETKPVSCSRFTMYICFDR